MTKDKDKIIAALMDPEVNRIGLHDQVIMQYSEPDRANNIAPVLHVGWNDAGIGYTKLGAVVAVDTKQYKVYDAENNLLHPNCTRVYGAIGWLLAKHFSEGKFFSV